MTADDYTPTTEDIRDYIGGGGDIGGFGSLTTEQEANRVAAFDRWLAAHDAEMLAAADRIHERRSATKDVNA